MQMISRLLRVVLLFAAVSLSAAEKAAPKPGAGAKRLPLQGTVVAVTTQVLTLKGGKGKPDRKFTINKDTVVVKGENPATTADVKVGQRITGSYYKNAEAMNILTKLQVAPKPVAKKGESDVKKKAS